jgi:tRNA threonylcarbamoyladenosine biosynthesis protein TsaE
VSPVRVLSNSPGQTIEAGMKLGKMLHAGSTVCLFGSLGAGKTTFVKGIGRALGVPERDIMSASFTIVAEHETDPPFYHIDLYRIKDEADLESTGVYDFIGSDGIAVIEWAEKIDIPEGHISVTINLLQDESREIIIEGIDEKSWNNMQALHA